MGKLAVNKLVPYKTLCASINEVAPSMSLLAKAGSTSKPAIRIPEGILTSMRGFARVQAWVDNNRAAIERFQETKEGVANTKTRTAGST